MSAWSVFWEKVNRKIDFILYKRTVFDKDWAAVHNIFDYNNTISRRPCSYIENCTANVMYSMGYFLRKYSGYKGRLYVGTEHAMPNYRTNNTEEYRDIDAPMVFVSCSERREVLTTRTDKLLIPFGPNFVPYVCGEDIYSEFALEQMKKVLGRTIVVFPQHNTDVHAYVGFVESAQREIDFVNNLAKEKGYDTIIACLYHVDITRGMAKMYEDAGWVVVSSGHHHNYDFGRCLKAVHQLADLTITQGVTGVPYSIYWGVPVMYYKAVEEFVVSGNNEVQEEFDWVVPVRRDLERLFGEYTDHITDEQMEYTKAHWGLEETKTPEQMKALLEFAKEIRKCYKDDKKVLKKVSKPKYACIKADIEEAVRIRKEQKPFEKK